MTANLIPVRTMNQYGIISTRLLNTDGTEPPAGAPTLPTTDYPTTRLHDYNYRLDRTIGDIRKLNKNFLWLSNNNPLLFEAVLCFLETLHEDDSTSISKLLDHPLKPSRHAAKSYIYAYYRQLIDTTPLMHTLAADGYHGGTHSRIAILFNEARTGCGNTVEHPHFPAVVLAVWITQTRHFSKPLLVKDYEADIALIHEMFHEVYDARHELRARNTIDSAVIEDLLQTYGPLRAGSL